jgi:hypothetical protein
MWRATRVSALATPVVATALLASALLATVLLSCSGGTSRAAGCGPAERQQAQFPANHVLPGQPEPSYLSDPPTSGPHAALARVEPLYETPLPRPTQVGILEAGKVLAQYRPDLPADQVTRLRQLAGGSLVVAPNPALDHAVVTSAWLYLQRCTVVDEATIGAFVKAHGGKGPGGPLDTTSTVVRSHG